jgi:acyl carrier protein
MRDAVANKVRTVVAEIFGVDASDIKPETLLRAGDLGFGWRKLYRIASELEHTYGIQFDIGAADRWTTVTDVILATEEAIARTAAAIAAGRAQRGEAA